MPRCGVLCHAVLCCAPPAPLPAGREATYFDLQVWVLTVVVVAVGNFALDYVWKMHLVFGVCVCVLTARAGSAFILFASPGQSCC